MTQITNHLPTAELQALDAAHHIHPFTANQALGKKGARIITRAKGVMLTDSDGRQIVDGMAGLWCVNIGYGRTELATVAARQIEELSYYNTFFQTSHVPAIGLAAPESAPPLYMPTGVAIAEDGDIYFSSDIDVRIYRLRKG